MLPVSRSASPFHPQTPHHLEETGLSHSLAVDLALRHAFFEGTVRLGALGQRMRLSSAIVQGLYRYLQKEQLCETRGSIADDYEIALTNRGRAMADVALKKSQYAGPAPVTLEDYNFAVSQQGMHPGPTAEVLRRALDDLVIEERVIGELGTALVTGGTILLYGGTGNGKTSIAERLHRIFDDTVYIPHAVAVGGQIMAVYDPLIHRAIQEQPVNADPRWVLCERPMVKVGGELRAEMLEPRVDEVTRLCIAPVQMKANNGILLIDDFGRQRISPRELLNRWIVPLDRRTDVLSLWSGVSFEMPFEVLVVFATNLNLSDLAEDAFLRRLKNKIRIECMSAELFGELLRRVCRQQDLPCTPETEQHLRERCLQHASEGLRPCFPADITAIVKGVAKFEQRPPTFGATDIDRAISIYFGR